MIESGSDERGSMLPLLGGLIFVALIVVALALDVARLHGAYVEVGLLADVASESGAAMIDEAGMHDGVITLDADRAVREVDAAVGAGDDRAVAEFVDGSLCVTITREHRTIALGFVGAATVAVAVRSCAEPMAG